MKNRMTMTKTVLAVVGIAACGANVDETDATRGEVQTEAPRVRALQEEPEVNTTTYLTTDYTIEHAAGFSTPTGPILLVSVRYGGGCGVPHDWALTWDGGYTELGPEPIFEVVLRHASNGDFCEAYLQDVLMFEMGLPPFQGPGGLFHLSGGQPGEGAMTTFPFDFAETCDIPNCPPPV